MQARLDATKAEVQSVMTRSRWKEAWQQEITKWMEKIRVVAIDNFREGVLLPLDSKKNYYLSEAHTSATLSEFSTSTRNIEDAFRYHHLAANYLIFTPKNLIVDIFRHFVTSFGGKFLTNEQTTSQYGQNNLSNYYSPNYSFVQWFYVGDEDKHHHEIIYKSLVSKLSYSKDDRWINVLATGIQLGGKLLPMHYVDRVLQKLRDHQTERMIELHFAQFNCALIKKVATAKQFCKLLYSPKIPGSSLVVQLGIGNAIYRFRPTNAANSKNPTNSIPLSAREAAKTFDTSDENSDWTQALKNPAVSDLLTYAPGESLSTADVRFIICCFIDAAYDYTESSTKIAAINTISTGSRKFPSDMDNFSNFDPPHLRGLLAETVLSKKLKGHALSMEETLTGEFAAIAPSALTEIVAQYLPVDILNGSEKRLIK